MSTIQVVVQGTLKPDGTLELEKTPSVPAGPVEVTIRSLQAATPRKDWWQYLQRARAELEAMGHRFANESEIARYIAEIRSDEERSEEAYRQIEMEPEREAGPPC
jgi:hypothetical protein